MSSRVRVACLAILSVVSVAVAPASSSPRPSEVVLEAPVAATSDAAVHDPSSSFETWVATARSACARVTRGTPQAPSSTESPGCVSAADVDPPRFAFRRPAPRSSGADDAGPH